MHERASPAGRGPDPDHGIPSQGVGRDAPVRGEEPLWHLQRDRVHAESVRVVDARRRGHARDVEVLERAQVAEVEDRPEVDVEPVKTLPREHGVTAPDVMNRLARERAVVRRRRRPDVARRAREVLAEHLSAAVHHAGHRVELPTVPVSRADRLNRARVVQERVRVAHLGRELELVGDLGLAVSIVVDVNGVQDVITKLEEVRSPERSLERQVVGDDGDRVRVVG